MKIELSTSEIWDLLKEGSTNQRNFIDSLYYNEFEEFIEIIEMECPEIDLRDLLNGGCLFVEDTPEDVEEEYIVYKNGRIAITLY